MVEDNNKFSELILLFQVYNLIKDRIENFNFKAAVQL